MALHLRQRSNENLHGGARSAAAPAHASQRYNSYLSALSFLCPLEKWCLYSDRAICTDSFSWRAHCRSRRSLLRRAAPSPPGSRSPVADRSRHSQSKEAHTLVLWLALCCVALVVVVVCVWGGGSGDERHQEHVLHGTSHAKSCKTATEKKDTNLARHRDEEQ